MGNSSVLCGVCCCYALHPNEFSPCKLRATDLRLILDNFRTQLFEPTSPNCWASLGVVVGNSLVICGVCCCYALHPDELSPCKPRAQDLRLILDNVKNICSIPLPPPVGHHWGLLWVIPQFSVAFAVAMPCALINYHLASQGRHIHN